MGTMNRSERAQMAVLDRVLTERTQAMRDADERALRMLRGAGFRFGNTSEAIAFQERAREAARVEAAMVQARSQVSGRRVA